MKNEYKNMILLGAFVAVLWLAVRWANIAAVSAVSNAASQAAALPQSAVLSTSAYSDLLSQGVVLPGAQFSMFDPDTLASGVTSSGESPQALFYGGSVS